MDFLGPYGALANNEIDIQQINFEVLFVSVQPILSPEWPITHPLTLFYFLEIDAKHVKICRRSYSNDEPQYFGSLLHKTTSMSAP